jgi:Sporulation and spore germination
VAVLVAAAAAALVGCGVPTSGAPSVIAASDVPYGLASPTPTAPSSSPQQTMLAETGIYLVGLDDVLVLRGRELTDGPIEDRLDELFDALAAGPTEQEREDELSTALPPEVQLDATEFSSGTVTVDISGTDAPSGTESRRAIGQIVLTATSLPEVRAVRLTLQGEPVEAPLPGGELTSQPLTAEDFEAFLTAQPSAPSPATTTPPSAPPRSTAPTAAPSS